MSRTARTARPTADQVAANLTAIRSSATADQVAEGRRWYGDMGDFIRTVRDDAAHETGDYGVSDSMAVGIFAAFSQNATWKANVTMARNYLTGNGRGMKSVLAECEALEHDCDPTDTRTLGLKRADFCANLLGDMSRVTCDRWHLRAAFATDAPPALKSDIRDMVTAATTEVAAAFGESPAQCQAVIWCAIRPSGDGK